MSNKIEQALNEGKRIQHNTWTTYWIKKHSDNLIEDKNGDTCHISHWTYNKTPNEWRILPNDIEPEEPQTEIQKAIKLLIENNYEVYHITKTQIVL